jgi:hypothetical protein
MLPFELVELGLSRVDLGIARDLPQSLAVSRDLPEFFTNSHNRFTSDAK